MSFLAPRSTIALLILQDDALKVLVQKADDGSLHLPAADADPAQDRDLAFTCRRIIRNMAGGMDCHLHPVLTRSGGLSAKGWGVNQIWAGIARAEDLPESIHQNALFADMDALLAFRGDDEEAGKVRPVRAGDELFMLSIVREHLRAGAHLSKFPAMLLSRSFTLPEMKRAYEIVSGIPIDDSSFRRKVEFLGIIREVGERRGVSRRPARTYELVGARLDFDRSLVFPDRH